ISLTVLSPSGAMKYLRLGAIACGEWEYLAQGSLFGISTCRVFLPEAASHWHTVPSAPIDNKLMPSGEKRIPVTRSSCPPSGDSNFPLGPSQRRTDWPAMPQARTFSSSRKAKEKIRQSGPARVPIRLPVATSQSCKAPSREAAASVLFWGEKANQEPMPCRPARDRTCFP